MFYAHSANSQGRCQPLVEHLTQVAELARSFAEPFGAGDLAYLAGLLHDLGKYGYLFQRRLQGKESGIDHWSAGAWRALTQYRMEGIAPALAIQGHHVGLQQASPDSLRALDPKKLQVRHPMGLRLSEANPDLLVERMRADGLEFIGAQDALKSLCAAANAPCAAGMLDVRMLYSALVDADFSDTAAHFKEMAGGEPSYREPSSPLQPRYVFAHLQSYIEDLAAGSTASSQINCLRRELLESCLKAACSPPGVFTLTAPTGTGKTLAMLAFALRHAAEHDLRRIILVIPYLNIIEQTAEEYRKALAQCAECGDISGYILEHHSLAGNRASDRPDENTDMEDEGQRRRQALAENWNAPIVVTTSVQFLESLFASRSAACRKLHNIAKSVILFDEVQTLPASLAVATLATLSRVAERFGSSVVFATATQPAFTHLDRSVKQYCALGWQPREIAPSELNLFARAKRTEIQWPEMTQTTSWPLLAEQVAGEPQVLCIVNLKRHALHLYDELNQLGVEGLFHLSTNMCPAHRQATLKEVRGRLSQGNPCRLISTQCVEAGVDIDFPTVYRALGPLDAIAQAAGRCNRNGHAESGAVHVFAPEDEAFPDGAYRQAADVTRILLQRYGRHLDIQDPELFDEYYRTLYDFAGTDHGKKVLMDAMKGRNFSEVATLYRVIDNGTINVLVPYGRNDRDPGFEDLKNEVKRTGLKKEWTRKARPYAVGLFRPSPSDPVNSYLEPIPAGGRSSSEDWFIYLDKGHYDSRKGLVLPASSDCLIA
ncbi:MAG: CRISPR-associated helicase Cas3' [Chloroflexi bacterium]|nr:CRISPR-associated helicase Cas3' [Chloroflexota bacterium]